MADISNESLISQSPIDWSIVKYPSTDWITQYRGQNAQLAQAGMQASTANLNRQTTQNIANNQLAFNQQMVPSEIQNKQAQTGLTQAQTGQIGALLPGEVQGQNLQNTSMGQQIQQRGALFPGQLQAQSLQNQSALSNLQQQNQMFPGQLQAQQQQLQQSSAMNPLQVQAQKQQLQQQNLNNQNLVNTQLMPGMMAIQNETDPAVKAQKYQQLYQAAQGMGLNPSQFGFGQTLDQATEGKMNNAIGQFQLQMQMRQMAAAGTGTETIMNPQTGQPQIVSKYAAIGQTPMTKLNEPLGMQDASRLAAASTGTSALEQARQIYFDQNGNFQNSVAASGAAGVPGTQGRLANTLLEQAVTAKLQTVSPRGAVSQSAIDSAMSQYAPKPSDTTAEAQAKLNNLSQYLRTAQDLTQRPASQLQQEQNPIQNQLVNNTSAASVNQFRQNNPQLSGRSDSEIKSIIGQNVMQNNAPAPTTGMQSQYAQQGMAIAQRPDLTPDQKSQALQALAQQYKSQQQMMAQQVQVPQQAQPGGLPPPGAGGTINPGGQ